jgi:PEGA domain-containing protein
MKRHLSMWIGFAALAAWIVAAPAAAQDRAGASPPSGGGGGGATAASAPSGGGSSGGGGGSVSSGGGGAVERAGAGFGSGTRGEAGGHGGATGGSGIAIPRGEYSGSGSRYGATSGRSGAESARSGEGTREGVPEFSRPRDGASTAGTAIARPAGSTPPKGGTNYVIVPGGYYGYGYPYGYGYYGGYSGYYGGYYDPFYDPWYGGYYSSYSYPQSSGFSYASDDGALRLKIKPRNAEVYVDGYYVGLVDEFDGIFQRLHIEPGAHRIEVRAAGYETLVFEVKISPEHTTTYQGELKRIQ